MTSNKSVKTIDMTKGSIAKSLILYAIPIILSDFLQQLYSAVDSIVVGNIEGKVALAAVGETFFIITIFLGCFLGISLGATVSISRYFGAKNFKRMSEAIDTTLKLTFILSILFSVAGYLLVPSLLRLVGTADDVYADAYAYLSVYLGGIFAQIIYNMFSGILKAIGDSRRPLYVLGITAGLNVILDIIMVGPMHMGVAGAAWATIISQLVSCIVLWIMINKTPEFEKPILRKCGMDRAILKDTFKVGIPYSVQRTVIAISNTVVISYVNFFGSTIMAGWSIYQKIDQFVIGSIISLGAATTTFVAQNVGAKKIERIHKGVNIAILISLIVSVFYAIVFYVFRYPVIKLFNSDPEVVEFTATLFLSMLTVHTVNAFPQIHAGAMRSLDASTLSTLVMVGSYVVIRQIYLHLRWPHFQNVMLVVAAYHLTWVICAVFSWIFYEVAFRRFKRNNEMSTQS